ncbi:hypothetical protein KUH03_17135 [Sphingobacterium sp. E70]|uniref:hypothetical protein n=1 Tax=Sphingobacterium sp. E70 TaxID=2853439 RepID=UPI00211CF89A|nr:hypothetical protein [Sphingobacterium sp. E70]ULT28162.1 hypothetical protein KUH03_17135 [Sphingobacterium sp. E70]
MVSDLGEIVANQQTVNLAFATTNDYKNGVNLNMPAHLRVSKTTPYNLYVRATSTSFTSGANSIPLNVLRIGPMAGQSGMNTITLSSTAQQLIQNADPVIDRNLNMLYSILRVQQVCFSINLLARIRPILFLASSLPKSV